MNISNGKINELFFFETKSTANVCKAVVQLFKLPWIGFGDLGNKVKRVMDMVQARLHELIRVGLLHVFRGLVLGH
jgi:hypothetical protein